MICQPIAHLIDEATCWGGTKGKSLMEAFSQGADWTPWARTDLGLHYQEAFSNIRVLVAASSMPCEPHGAQDKQGEQEDPAPQEEQDCDDSEGTDDPKNKETTDPETSTEPPVGSLVLKVVGKRDICISVKCECTNSEVTLEKNPDGTYKGFLGEVLAAFQELSKLERNKYVPLSAALVISNTANDHAKVALCDGAGFQSTQLFEDDQGVTAMLYFKCA